jgi:16S rRNA processing protein RimM
MDAEAVVIADILRPRGNRGELLAASQTDVPSRLENLKSAEARLSNGQAVQVEIESAWTHKDLWVLKFAGIDSIDAAERFRGAELCVPMTQRGCLPEGEYFQSDLIGCTVVEKHSGERLGSVEGCQQYGGPPLLELRVNGREVLIPFVPSICQEVDLAGRKIVVDLPEGLLEL